MTKSELEVAEIRADFAKWWEKYEPIEFVDDYGSDEGKQKLANAGEDHIFTYNTTCTEEIMTQGLNDYSGSCCWQVHGYWITKKPWTEQVWLAMSVSVPCLSCNPKEIEDLEGQEDCEACGGTGFGRYYAEG